MPRTNRDGAPAAQPLKRKLNQLLLTQLKPQARPFLIWDTHQRGLALQVRPTGHRSWKCIYSLHGRPRYIDPSGKSAPSCAVSV